MPYGVTVGALAMIFIIIEIVYIAQRKLLPNLMMMLSFILLVLFLAGIIGTAIQLFAGPNINNQCNTYVFNDDSSGPNTNTLAYLQQRNICKSKNENKRIEANKRTRSMLASRLCVLDRGHRLPGLDDDHGEPGQLEYVPRLSDLRTRKPPYNPLLTLLDFIFTASVLGKSKRNEPCVYEKSWLYRWDLRYHCLADGVTGFDILL